MLSLVKRVFISLVLLAFAGIVRAQQAEKPPMRTSDPSPLLKRITVVVPVSTSSAAIPRAKAAQAAPIRKADLAGEVKPGPSAAKGQQEKTLHSKTLPPSATPVVSNVTKQ